MQRTHDTMMNPPIEELLDRVDSKFSLVTLAARRARQINSYFSQLGDGLGHMVPPQVSSVARKPLSIGFEEIAADKIVGIATDPVDELAGFDGATFDATTFEGVYEGEEAGLVDGEGEVPQGEPVEAGTADEGGEPEAGGPDVEA